MILVQPQCPSKHFGNCIPLCSTCDKRHLGACQAVCPSLYPNTEHLPTAGVETPAPTLSARAAGKQPVRSAVSSSPSSSRAQIEIEKPVCATCHKRHFGECRGFCSTCGFGHPGICRDPCSTCGILHRGICWELSKIRARDLALLEAASKQDIAPEPEEQNDASTSSVPETTSNTEPAEMTESEDDSCKHSRRDICQPFKAPQAVDQAEKEQKEEKEAGEEDQEGAGDQRAEDERVENRHERPVV
jgi:hypothetical protein